MESFTLSDGTTIPTLGFGTYKLTGPTCTEMVSHALEVGYRHIDTAVYYNNHTAIAPALKPYPRESLYLTSKLPDHSLPGDQVVPACRQILDELETDYLDLLLIHAPNRSIPLDETLGAMRECQKRGWVRSLGVSNFTTRHCSDALETGVPIVMNQVEFHPYLNQRELLHFCRGHGITLTSYCSVARGQLSDEPILQKIGKAHEKTPSQVGLRWLIQHGIVAIPKTSHLARLKENFTLFDFRLTSSEMEQIDRLHTGVRIVDGVWTDFDYI